MSFGEVRAFYSGRAREIGAGLGIAKHVIGLPNANVIATGDRILEGFLAFEVNGCVHVSLVVLIVLRISDEKFPGNTGWRIAIPFLQWFWLHERCYPNTSGKLLAGLQRLGPYTNTLAGLFGNVKRSL